MAIRVSNDVSQKSHVWSRCSAGRPVQFRISVFLLLDVARRLAHLLGMYASKPWEEYFTELSCASLARTWAT